LVAPGDVDRRLIMSGRERQIILVASNAAAIFAATLFGASVVATRMVAPAVPPTSLAFLRCGLGALILLIFGLCRSRRRQLLPKRSEIARVALLGVLLFGIFPVGFNAGLALTEASRGALALATIPVWSVWFARKFAGERLGIRQRAGVALAAFGIALAVGPRALAWRLDPSGFTGDCILIVTAAVGALYAPFAKDLVRARGALFVMLGAMVVGAAALAPIASAEGLFTVIQNLDGRSWMLVVFLAVAGAVGYSLWTWSLRVLSPTQIAVYIALNPVVAMALGAALLGEQVSPSLVAGAVATTVGVYFVSGQFGGNADEVQPAR
jgi:drug/metabolite transporter (DMT)-like permease